MTNLFTVAQACEALQVCRNTIKAMIADGRLEAKNIGTARRKIWRIDISSAGEEMSLQERLKMKNIERRMGI